MIMKLPARRIVLEVLNLHYPEDDESPKAKRMDTLIEMSIKKLREIGVEKFCFANKTTMDALCKSLNHGCYMQNITAVEIL